MYGVCTYVVSVKNACVTFVYVVCANCSCIYIFWRCREMKLMYGLCV